MANEQARETLRASLNEFDDSHLQKIRVAAYDRWTWDSNSESDKDWYELAEEILTDRGVDVTANTINMIGPNGNPMAAITMESTGDLILGVNGSVKVTDASNPGCIQHELFGVSNSNQLQLGWELKQAIAAFVTGEILNGNSGMSQNIRSAITTAIVTEAPAAVRNLL